MRAATIALLAAAAAALPAFAQPSPKDLYKGKVREGLYEVRRESDLSGVPGIPKEQTRSSETRQRCLSKDDVARGIEAGKDCRISSYKPAEAGTDVVMECQDGSVTNMKYTFSASGFSAEQRITGKQDGKPFVSVFRSQAKYLGPCPQKQ